MLITRSSNFPNHFCLVEFFRNSKWILLLVCHNVHQSVHPAVGYPFFPSLAAMLSILFVLFLNTAIALLILLVCAQHCYRFIRLATRIWSMYYSSLQCHLLDVQPADCSDDDDDDAISIAMATTTCFLHSTVCIQMQILPYSQLLPPLPLLAFLFCCKCILLLISTKLAHHSILLPALLLH